ncbi:MAG: hypothetical protein WCE64_01285 [Bacteroidales bacterium]
MYHVTGTGLTAIILYLLSWFLYRNGFYSQKFHRKIWNTLLALAFICTALAGIFLALQINYKWNIPVIKTILSWHVEFGIATALTGIFHFVWHLKYFKEIFGRSNHEVPEIQEVTVHPGNIGANLFIIGFISSALQLLLLKEIMNISGGYELIAGTFLGSWLTGSAAGSVMAGRSRLTDIRKINLVFSLSPLASIALLLLLARLFLKTGETPSFLVSIIYTFLVLFPFCFVSGFAFVKLINTASSGNNWVPGKSFSIETIGGIAAGIAVSVVGSGRINTYQTLLLVVIMGIAYSLLTFFTRSKTTALLVRITASAISAFIVFSSPDVYFRQALLRGTEITESNDTPYGNITKGVYGGEQNIYYDQRLMTYGDDVAEREENIHYALLQSDNPRNVLLISGRLASCLQELGKYPVRKVVYVERDPALAAIEEIHDSISPVNLVVKNEDALGYITRTSEKFDAALVMLPAPSSLLLNRYYTSGFFRDIKNIMQPDGIFCCSPGINTNYFNQESINLYSSIFNSLKSAFGNVIPVAGNKLYFIASDKELSTAFCDLSSRRQINNIYVGPDYLSDELTAVRSSEVTRLMDQKTLPNTGAFPIASFYFQTFSLSKNLNEKIPAIILLVILFILPMATMKRTNMMMAMSALALAGYEIILLLMLQLTVGNMYQVTGLIVAGIMAGLAAGSGLKLRFRMFGKSWLKALVLITLYLLVFLAVDPILQIRSRFMATAFLVLSGFLPALVTGSLFRILTMPGGRSPAASAVYSADLRGSALGFIVFSGLIIPLCGIRISLLLLPVLIFAGFLSGPAGSRSRI